MGSAALSPPTTGAAPAVELALLRQTAALATALQAARIAAALAAAPPLLASTARAAAQAGGVGRALDVRG